MAVVELQNFRKKYPDYNDIGDAELAEMLAKKYPDAYGDLPGKVQTPPPASIDPTEGMNTTQKVLAGIGKGMTEVVQGTKQGLMGLGEKVGVVPKGRTAEYTRKLQEEEEMYDRPLLSTMSGKVGRIVGNVAGTLPAALIPGAGSASVPVRLASLAAQGGTASAAMPVKEGESRLQNIVTGAGLGAGVGGVMAAGGKAYNLLRGNLSVSRASDLGSLSRTYGVPLTVGEMRGSVPLQRVETVLEKIPLVGTRAFRQNQSQALKDAADMLVERFKPAGMGDDVGEALQGSLKAAERGAKDEATRLFDVVEQIAAAKGGNVSFPSLRTAVTDITARENQLPAQFRNSGVLQELKKYSTLQDVPFDVARKIRSRFGNEIRRLEKQQLTGTVSDEQVAMVKQLKSALEGDIRDFANQGTGDLRTAFDAANKHYVEEVVPFKDKAIRKAGKDDFDTDQIITTFIKSNRPQLAGKLMSRLDAEGQATVKFAILKDAFEQAIDTQGKVPFSPAKFASSLEKLGKTKKVVFSQAEANHIEGFTRLARAAERAGQYAENPPTGQRIIDAAIVGGGGYAAAHALPQVASAAGMSFLLSKLLTSDSGRKLLTRASGIPPHSKAMTRLLQVELPRVMAVSAARETEKGKPARTLQDQE